MGRVTGEEFSWILAHFRAKKVQKITFSSQCSSSDDRYRLTGCFIWVSSLQESTDNSLIYSCTQNPAMFPEIVWMLAVVAVGDQLHIKTGLSVLVCRLHLELYIHIHTVHTVNYLTSISPCFIKVSSESFFVYYSVSWGIQGSEETLFKQMVKGW